MKRGPKTTPTTVKELRGNPGKRPLPEREPKPKVHYPRAPKWITADAECARIWREVEGLLGGMGVVTKADRLALAALVEACRDGRDGVRILRGSGLTMEKRRDRGSVSTVRHPVVAVRNDAWRRLTQQLARFGLDPTSRTGIETLPEELEDEFDEYLRRRDH